jgi:ABC-type dipeptide/oligopeptide/nickel transport system permease component
MLTYVVRRAFQSLFVIFGVTLLSFVSLHASGDPTYLYANERASNEEIAKLRVQLGFDRPLAEQYLSYMNQLVHGDLGKSLRFQAPSLGLILERLPATLELTLFAMAFSITLAIPIGIISATRRGTTLDGGIMLFAMIGQSIPSFWLGIMLILFFGLTLRWLPISGHTAVLQPLFQGDIGGAISAIPDALRYLIMPGVTIAVFSLARTARLVRSSMLETLPQDYVTTARSKGLREFTVIIRHAFRNALIPVVTMLGLEFGFLLSGVVVVETVFSWPGVGRLVFNAITQKDIPLVQASVIVFALMFVVLNLSVDILYGFLDPRVRLG